MPRKPPLKVGSKICPACAETVKSEAKICKHCGHVFTASELEEQAAFEHKVKRWSRFTFVLIAFAVAFLVWRCSGGTPKPGSSDTTISAVTTAEEAATATGSNERLAKATAIAAVQQNMKNPASFELADISAMQTKGKKGDAEWLVGVTYRGSNSFGGTVPGNALVTTDESGLMPLKVIDLTRGSRPGSD